MTSLKGNIILNYLNTLTGILFPLITFPYATRILHPEGIGTIDFLNSIINYILLFSALGLPFYGVREIAKYRDNATLRQQKLIEIAGLNMLLAFIAYIVVFLLATFVPRITQNNTTFYILSLAIFFSVIGVQWFYQGIEDFKLITIRGILVRIVCALGLFIFVKTPQDLIPYAFIVVATSVGNNVINFLYLKKYIRFSTISWKTLNIYQHIKPSFKFFVMFIFISVFIYLNSVILGFLKGNESVGFYTAGFRIPYILKTVIASLGAVMLPRATNLLEKQEFEQFKSLTKKTYHFVFLFALPFSVALMLFSYIITITLCGKLFINSVAVVLITTPTILIVGLSDVIGMHILLPKNKDNIMLKSIAIASFISLLLNFSLIPFFAEKGAAIATLLTETAILVFEIIWGYKYIPFKLFSKNIQLYIISTLIMLPFILICLLIPNYFISLSVALISGGFVYFTFLYYKKEEITVELLHFIGRIIKIKS